VSHSSLTAASPQHSRATRFVHAGLAGSILVQLGTSLVMQGPRHGQAGDALFQLHQYAGFAALGFALAFWLVAILRHRGTDLAVLVPWFSPRRIRAVLADLFDHLRAALAWQLPAVEESGPLASAVHGLGLILVTVVAASGAVYGVEVWTGLIGPEPRGVPAMTVHLLFANLTWVYLIGHASLAMLHHLAQSVPLTRMWSLGR